MEIIKLKPGEDAPAETDCIRIERAADGSFTLATATLDGSESVAMVAGGPYASYDEAEAAGLSWAAGHGAKTVYIEPC